jgi:hypothetical protein
MHPTALIRRAAVLLLSGCAALGQSPALPATPPTQLPVSAAPSAARSGPARHPAGVIYSDGLLEVDADNSSLNQILRAIAAATGMSISGGVIDQGVFGKYGPAKPAEVLASLLHGTGANMVLRETRSDLPVELVLTPEHGGPSPPSPNATAGEDAVPADQSFRPPFQPAPSPGAQPQPVTQPAPVTESMPPPFSQADPPSVVGAPAAPPSSDIPTAPNTAPTPDASSTGATSPQSPNGVKTPQQIYQQLQQLQQRQQQQQH